MICVLLVIAVMTLTLFLVRCQKGKDGYCPSCGTCQGMGNKTYPDRAMISTLYREGKLTENSPRGGSNGWTQADHRVGLTTPCSQGD